MGGRGVTSGLRRIADKKRWDEDDGRTLVTAWRSSGLSAEAFAAELGVGGWRIRAWVRRLDARPAGKPPRFVPVQLVDSQAEDAGTEAADEQMQVELSSGLVVRVGRGVPAEEAAALVAELVRVGC